MPKRSRRFTWSVKLAVPGPLIAVTRAVTYVSDTLYLTITDGTISTQAVSSAKSCIVMGQVSTCDTFGTLDEPMAICVSAKTMLNAVSSASDAQTLTIGQVDDDAVVVDVCDERGRRGISWKIPLVATDQFLVTMDGMDYTSEWMYETQTLRTDLKRCRSVGGQDRVRLELRENAGAEGAAPMRSVWIHASGSAGEVNIHHTSRIQGDGAHAASVDAGGAHAGLDDNDESDDDEVDTTSPPMFAEQYDVGSLMDFLRCVDSPCVHMRMGHQQPLMLEVQLPPENTGFLKFAQAPVVEA